MRILWIIPVLGAIFGGVELLSFFSATSAPQQAAAASLAVALAVIPYCLMRSLDGMIKSPVERQLELLNDQIATQTKIHAAVANQAIPVVDIDPK